MHKVKKIADKYSIMEALGKGKFGDVYRGTNDKTAENVAIKMESIQTPIKLLKHETSLLKYLHDHGCRNIPMVYWYGPYENNSCLVMSCYESSLYNKINSFHKNNKEVPIEKINSIMGFSIEIIESIHKNFVLHRDIKPQNFMLCLGELFLIDFGLSTFYINEDKDHISVSDSNDHITGTPRYISYNIHDGMTPSRRDDMISLGYIYIWMSCGELPWDNIIDDGSLNIIDESYVLHNKNQQRKDMKSIETVLPICEKINQNIYKYLNYCYGLSFKDTPNYEELKKLFN